MTHETITTVEELEALPVGSVIRTAGVPGRYQPRVAENDGDSLWRITGDEFLCECDELDDLPATVLYRPDREPAPEVTREEIAQTLHESPGTRLCVGPAVNPDCTPCRDDADALPALYEIRPRRATRKDRT